MKKPVLLLFLLFILLITINSCKTEEEQPLVRFDPVFLSYFAFPKGSWWTYKEVKSGKTDSFYVNKYNIGLELNRRAGNIHYERLTYHLFSKNDTSYGQARPDPNFKLNTTLYVYTESYHAGPYNFNNNAIRFIYPSEENETFNNNFYMRTHLDTITVNNVHYKDIYRTENITQAYYNPIKSEYYCRNVGVIKRVYFDSTVWELTNYHHNK